MTPISSGRSRALLPKAAVIGLALVTAALAGCTQNGVIYNSQQYLSGTMLYVNHAAGSRMPAVIRGNPSALPKVDFDRIVRDHMKGANFGAPITFVPGPDNPPFPDQRVVLVFNGPIVGQKDLCQGTMSGGGGPAQDGRIELVAAFCSGDRPVSALSGGIGGITDPNDPHFRSFLRLVGMTLFNPNNPDDRPGNNGLEPPVP